MLNNVWVNIFKVTVENLAEVALSKGKVVGLLQNFGSVSTFFIAEYIKCAF